MARGRKTGGRQKGTPNKFNAEVRDMVLAALNEVGGVKYLKTSAKENPAAFLALVGKLMPRPVELSGEVKSPPLVNRIVLVAGKQEGESDGQ